MIGVVCFILSPLVLLLFYAIPFVHPLSTLMMRDVISLKGYNRQWVRLDDMSPYLINSVMMSEDGQFCSHSGVDWGAIQSEVVRRGGPARGASTITMQMTKNLFLWHDRSYLRKGVEIPLALFADTVLSKRRIMEIYLNIAEWGPGIYGVQAASGYYFNRSARDLTPRQAALLAVSLPNPYIRDPARPSARLSQLARVIEARAHRSGAYILCLQ